MWDWIKGLFTGSKGTTQLGYRNKSVTAGDNANSIVVADTVHMGHPPAPAKVPVVDFSLALGSHPFRGIVNMLSIELRNTSDRPVFITSFVLKTKTNNIYFQEDGFTGEPQHKKQVTAGDKISFNIDAAKLKEVGLDATEYIHAEAIDALGPRYKSESPERLQQCIAQLLAG